MNCAEFLDRLQQQLDGVPVPPEPALTAHLRDCATCAARQAAVRRLTAVLPLLSPVVPATDLTRQITFAALRDLRRRRLARRSGFAMALAAGFLLVVCARIYLAPNGTPRPDGELAAHSLPAPVAEPTAEPAPPPLRSTVAEAQQAVASLTTRTADEAMGQTRLLLPIVPTTSLADLDLVPRETPGRPLREASQNLTAGPELVATSARRAVDLFFRDISPGVGQSRGGS